MTILDAYGQVVSPNQQLYQADVNGAYITNPEYMPPATTANVIGLPSTLDQYAPGLGQQLLGSGSASSPAQTAVAFDTIGQIIYRSVGSSRFPIKLLWVKGVINSGDVLTGDSITFAVALTSPLDQGESGEYWLILGDQVIFTPTTGVVIPPNITDPLVATQLTATLTGMRTYPGTDGQLPDPSILEDRGVRLTPAFRGMRYMVFSDWPVAVPYSSLTVIFNRTTPGIQGQAGTSTPLCRTSTPVRKGAPIATGDSSCAIAYTPNGGETFIQFGTEQMTGSGGIAAGITTRRGDYSLYIIAGNGPVFDRAFSIAMFRYYKIPLYSPDTIIDWQMTVMDPDPINYTKSDGTPQSSDGIGVAHNPATGMYYLWVELHNPAREFAPTTFQVFYRSSDGINYVAFQEFGGGVDGGFATAQAAFAALGSNKCDLDDSSFVRNGNLTATGVNPVNGDVVTMKTSVQTGILLRSINGGPFVTMPGFTYDQPGHSALYVQGIYYGGGRFTAINLRVFTSVYSDDFGDTWIPVNEIQYAADAFEAGEVNVGLPWTSTG